ncbi:unnamed protein product [Phytophthora fragariaefolia]|uniref:Unnamed protein product n=1 Tax=Phytophthora fragariaefolia TaxID=1490495 RepID=A0A9W6Y5Z0_9STRA|nr:unnamed protein product [Phytophthora fragariaefolia]
MSSKVYSMSAARRPREDDSNASSSKRSCSGSDRPLADAGPLSSPRSGGDSTSSNTVVSRTGPVRDPWMPTPSEIHTRFGSTAPPSQYALCSCSGIKDDDVTKELDIDPATDQRRDYFIGLFHELRWYGNKKTSRRSRVPEWQALCQSWVPLLKTSTRTQLVTPNAFAWHADAMSASPSAPRLIDCTGVQSTRVFRVRCRWASRASTARSGQCACPNGTLAGTRVSVCPRN